MGKPRKRLFIGNFFLAAGLLTEEQVEAILEEQKRSKTDETFGDIAVRLNFITNRQRIAVGTEFEIQSTLARLHENAIWIPENLMRKALKELLEERALAGRGIYGTHYYNSQEWMDALLNQQRKLGKPPLICMINKRTWQNIEEEFFGKGSVPILNPEAEYTVVSIGTVNLVAVDNVRTHLGIDPENKASWEEVDKLCRALYSTRRMQHYDELPDVAGKQIILREIAVSGIEEDQEAVQLLNSLFLMGVRRGATDIHLEPMDHKIRVRYRVDGSLRNFCDLPLEIYPRLVSRIKILCGLDITDKRHHQDGKIRSTILGEDIDLRVSTYSGIIGENVVIRYLPKVSENRIDQLGMAPNILDMFLDIIESPSGVILFTGPTGCGKTTTLYGSLRYLNTQSRNIITVEDPVEYTLPGIAQCQVNDAIGRDYIASLKAILRQDPDVIVLGEIRDTDSAEAAVQAGLTGHLVFSTFHTDDSTSALLRLMDMGIETFLISSTVVSVVSQRLVRCICPFCKEPYNPPDSLFDLFYIKNFNPKEFQFYRGRGCSECNYSGYKGRTGIFELLKLNAPLRDAILAKKTSPEIRSIARRTVNLISMKEDGLYKAILGITTPEEILHAVYHFDSDFETARSIDQVFNSLEGYPPPRVKK